MVWIMADLSNVVLILVIIRMSSFHLINLLVQGTFQSGISVFSSIDILIRTWIRCNTDHRSSSLYRGTAAPQGYRYDKKKKRKNTDACEHGTITLYDLFQGNLCFYRHVLDPGNGCCSTQTTSGFSSSGCPVSILISFFLEEAIIKMSLLFGFLHRFCMFCSFHTFCRTKFQFLFYGSLTITSAMGFHIRSFTPDLSMTQTTQSSFCFTLCKSGTFHTCIFICFFLFGSDCFHARYNSLCSNVFPGCPSRFHTSTFHHLISFIIKG